MPGEVEDILQQGAFDHGAVAQLVTFVDFAVGRASRWRIRLADHCGIADDGNDRAFLAIVEGQVAIEPAAHIGEGIAQRLGNIEHH
ncbi:hypothetical protein D3C80_1805220 [compost metagenome]